MRLAVVADIHGNVLALERVADDLRKRKVDRVVNLGDCVSGPLWPRETVELLMSLGWPTVGGNHDRWVTDWPRERQYPGDAYACSAIGPVGKEWLKSLPSALEFEDVVAIHGRPDDDNAYLLENVEHGRLVRAADKEIRERLGTVRAGVVLCAHSHLARQVAFDGRHIVNPGSVGQPAYADPTPPAHVSESGSPNACYSIVDRDENTTIENVVVEYDHFAAAKRAADNGSPAWAHFLSTGLAR
jgi:putative phosphoesterase